MPNKTSKYVSDLIVNSDTVPIRDPFRAALGSYWKEDRSRRTGRQELVFKDYLNNEDRKVDVSFATEQDYRDEDETQTLPARKITLVIDPHDVDFLQEGVGEHDVAGMQADFKEYLIGAIDSGHEFFEDHHFKINKPLTSAEKVIVADADASLSSDVNIEFKYNFYNEFYEEAIQDPIRPEIQIENVYNYIFEPLTPRAGRGPMGRAAGIKKVTLLLKGVDVFDDLSDITIPSNEAIGYKNVYIPYEHTRELNEHSNLSKVWPMSVNIRMKFDTNSMLPGVLNEHFLAEHLIRHASEDPIYPVPYKIDEQSYDETGRIYSTLLSDRIKEVNVLRWFEDRLSELGRASSELPSNYTFLGDTTEGTLVSIGIRSDYLLLTSFIESLANLSESRRRSFEDILNGVEAPSEIVAYKISKIDAARPDGDPIQDFWIFNTNDEVDIMDFIDTQVKYSKKYRYVVSALYAVYGTAYSYGEPWFSSTGAETYTGLRGRVDVVTRPTLRMYEIPIYENIGQIIENPPVPPSIDIIPYRGVGNKMRFHMNGGTGLYLSDPIILRDRDEAFYADYRQTYELETDAPITFKNDDAVSAFEIFRIDKHPTTYDDFRNKLRRRVSTDVNPRSPLKASSATYIEPIIPNKKFYYIFRALDVHGQPSLPSIVYRIEMIDDGATIFPIIEAVDFLSEYEIEKRNKMPVRSFRKLFYIAPKFSHSYFNRANSDMVGAPTAKLHGPDVYLGGEDEAIWKKKYRVRLISKSTGKKIDFNFEVNHKHIETEKERN
jgi:hypothetical protein